MGNSVAQCKKRYTLLYTHTTKRTVFTRPSRTFYRTGASKSVSVFVFYRIQ